MHTLPNLTVLSLSDSRRADPEGSIAVSILWPREDARGDMFVQGVQRIPVHVAATGGVDRPVRERYVLVATKDLVDFFPLVEDLGADALREDTRMPGVLRAAFLASRTRSSEPYRPAEWGVSAIDLVVKKR